MVFRSKLVSSKGVPYNEALKLNRLCLDNESFDIVVKNVAGRGYNKKND